MPIFRNSSSISSLRSPKRKEFTFFLLGSTFHFPHYTGAMSAPRKPVVVGLLLLMCALTEHCGESAPTAAAGGDAPRSLRRMVEIMKHVGDNRGRHPTRTEAQLTPRAVDSASVEQRDFRGKTDKGNQALGEWQDDDPQINHCDNSMA